MLILQRIVHLCKDCSLPHQTVKLRGSSPPKSKKKREWGCSQPCCHGSGSDSCSAHCKVPLACPGWALLPLPASRAVCRHSLTQFCQNDLVNLNAFNSKVFLKPNHSDRAGLAHCSCYNSTKSNFHLRGSCPPSAPTTCKLHIPNNRSPFPFLLHCSSLSLQLCYL